MSNTTKGPFLVTGASGHLGSQVIEALLAEGAEPIVAVTRSPEKLEGLRARGVEIRAGDFNDPAMLGPAFLSRMRPNPAILARPETFSAAAP